MKKILNALPTLLLLVITAIALNAQAATQMYFIHNDHLGTPQVVTDENQTIVWQGNKKPFGDTEETTATIDQQSRFPGQYFDEESGLSYNYYRDYDPTTGRYLQSDPIGLQGGINTYAYVDQNPLSFFDQYGLHKGDKLFGLPKKFWQWYHRNEKRPGDPDLDKDTAEDLHSEWKDQGEPGPDNKSDWKDPREWLIPPSIELLCLADPCNPFCAAWGYECIKDRCI